MERFSGEKKDVIFPKLEFSIQEPRGDKNYMITFESTTEIQTQAYNAAIRAIAEEENLNIFHQIGTNSQSENPPGFHGWEIYSEEINTEDVRALFPKIQEKAQYYYNLFSS